MSGALRPGTEFLCQSNKNPFGTADLAEPIRILVLHHVAKPSGVLIEVDSRFDGPR